MLRSIGLPELLVLLLFTGGVIVPFWKIFTKLGFSGALSLLMIVPLANIVVLYVVALARPSKNPPVLPAAAVSTMPGRAPIVGAAPRTNAFCIRCGTALVEDATFCGVCGSQRGQ